MGNGRVLECRVFAKSVARDLVVLVASQHRLVLLVGGGQAHVD